MKTIIIYSSTHHGNTYKLVEAIARKFEVEMINANKVKTMNLICNDFCQ